MWYIFRYLQREKKSHPPPLPPLPSIHTRFVPFNLYLMLISKHGAAHNALEMCVHVNTMDLGKSQKQKCFFFLVWFYYFFRMLFIIQRILLAQLGPIEAERQKKSIRPFPFRCVNVCGLVRWSYFPFYVFFCFFFHFNVIRYYCYSCEQWQHHIKNSIHSYICIDSLLHDESISFCETKKQLCRYSSGAFWI